MKTTQSNNNKGMIGYFTSYVISLLGNSIASIVLPILVLTSTGNVVLTGTVAVVGGSSTFISGLFSGPLIDRYDRRIVAAVSDFISAGSIFLLALVGTIGQLTPTWFIASAILSGLGDLPAWNSREAMIYGVQRYSGRPLQSLVGMRETFSALTIVIGPTSAGLLMNVLDDSKVLWVTAITSLTAGILCFCLPHEFGNIESTHSDTSRLAYWGSFYQGIKFLFETKNSVLRKIISLNIASIALVSVLQSLLIPVFMTQQGAENSNGYAIGAVGLGLLAGGIVYMCIGTRCKPWPLTIVASLLNIVSFILLIQFNSVMYTIAMCFIFGLTSAVVGAITGVISLHATPGKMRGRVNGLQNSISMIIGPISIFIVSWIISVQSVKVGGWVLVVFWVLMTLIFLGGPSVRQVVRDSEGSIE